MGRRLIGEAPTFDAERQQRRRDKAKEKPADQRDVVTVQANGSVPDPNAIAAPPAGKSGTDYPQVLCHPDRRTTNAATQKHHDRLMADGRARFRPPCIGSVRSLVRRPRHQPLVATICEVLRKSLTSVIYPVAWNPCD